MQPPLPQGSPQPDLEVSIVGPSHLTWPCPEHERIDDDSYPEIGVVFNRETGKVELNRELSSVASPSESLRRQISFVFEFDDSNIAVTS